jgi:hypothetical protein
MMKLFAVTAIVTKIVGIESVPTNFIDSITDLQGKWLDELFQFGLQHRCRGQGDFAMTHVGNELVK